MPKLQRKYPICLCLLFITIPLTFTYIGKCPHMIPCIHYSIFSSSLLPTPICPSKLLLLKLLKITKLSFSVFSEVFCAFYGFTTDECSFRLGLFLFLSGKKMNVIPSVNILINELNVMVNPL